MRLQTVAGDLEVQKMITGNKKATSFCQGQHEFTSEEMGAFLSCFMESFEPRLLVNSWKKASLPSLTEWPFFPISKSL